MARARNIKPGFFLNEDLAELPFEYRLLFIGLWTIADKDGRLEHRPKRIKMALFPADDVNITEGLALLNRYCFVDLYEVDSIQYVQITNWHKHQSPHHTEKQSTIPPPPDGGDVTVNTRKQDGGNPPDSLIHRFTDSLIPDSLNSMSGKPDALPPSKLNGKKAEAVEVLNFLNEKAGRAYRPTEANLGFIVARFKEGATVSDCRKVIAKKCREWATDEKMAEFLRPATLFNRQKFDQYIGEIVPQGGLNG